MFPPIHSVGACGFLNVGKGISQANLSTRPAFHGEGRRPGSYSLIKPKETFLVTHIVEKMELE